MTSRPPTTRARGANSKAAIERRTVPMPLATSVVGSFSVPEWLERVKTDYYQAVVTHAIPEHDEAEPPMGLLDDYRFTREYTDKPI
jgi:hypothetical protein